MAPDQQMTIRVDRSLCSGHARCHATAPDLYPLDEIGYNALEGEVEVAAEDQPLARRGALACPERAITLTGR